MFNGYNETPLISYEFSQERVEKKQENASKWAYSHEAGVQPGQLHPGSRQPELWSGKANFVGLSNVVKCSCTGCYPSSENQSYQGDTTCHRPWLPRTFPVPLNGSGEPYKLPAYQWDGGPLNQGPCYPTETNASPFVPENGGKHPFYRHYQDSRIPEPNQPGVITSLKNAEFGKKLKEEAPLLQNGVRQPVLCNPIYNVAKRADGRNYCDPNEKYSNAASFSVDQHIPRLPVVEPYIKAVPSNLSQNRVPSTGYRSIKENAPQSYLDPGYGDARKICPEQDIGGGDKRNENYPTVGLPSGGHMDYSSFGRDLSETEPQKLFFDNGRHSDYYSKKNFQNVINRNNQTLDGRKDCVISQIGQMSEQQHQQQQQQQQQYSVARSKYQETGKSSCDSFYPKNFDKTRLDNYIPENSPCFQRNEDKNENMNVHARLTRSTLIFNDPRFADRTQNSFPYQNNPAYRNYIRPEYPCQGYNAQSRYEYPAGFQRSDCVQYRGTPQQMQICDQFIPQQDNGFAYDAQYQQNSSDKTAQFYGGKNGSPILMDSLSSDGKKPTYLEPIRSDAINKNGTNKISPLRLLRKKKFINVPHEPTPAASTLDAAPGLDVRKFWSTWADEEEENVTPTEMVVLDCQNIDPEQAKLLHLYENDPVRAVELESGSIVLKGSKESAEEAVPLEEIAVPEEVLTVGPKNDAPANCEKQQQEEANMSAPCVEPESKPGTVEGTPTTASTFKAKIIKPASGNRGVKKAEVMDKWTEKKFDFLKRSEESKAAEILRHEEEKKKIFETRLSLQQSLKKVDKPQEKSGKHEEEKMAEGLSPFDENSQSSSPHGGSGGDVSSLPTSEYRRNKFLDYTDRKVIVNGKDKSVEDESIPDERIGDPLEADDIKKESVKLESALSTDMLFPVLDDKLKDKPYCEMDDILHKISEINFQNPEVKLENGTREVVEKKLRSPGKKVKKRKSDHQPENDQRADKLTLETVKFSIQKSHDLKISFKVLNNSKKCSDDELGSKGLEDQGNPVEDSQNSTELITLRYKSIQRDGDRRPTSESKKTRRRFRRKNAFDAKTPVLKIRKSRYASELETDPLVNYEDEDYDEEDDDKPDDGPKKPYSEEGYSTSDDFHVHETVDSAKIKLTFKRHKTGFEKKQYKTTGNNMGSLSDVEPTCDEPENHAKKVRKKWRKKSRRAKGDEIFAEADVESCRSPEVKYVIESGAESFTKEHEDVKNSETSQDYYTEEENYDSEIPSDTRLALATLRDDLYDNEELALESYNDNSTPSEEREKSDAIVGTYGSGQDQMELITNDVINRDDEDGFSLLGCSCENSKESTSGGAASFEKKREKKGDFEREEIREISLDFISSTNSCEIEINEESGKTEETDTLRQENNADTSEENVGPEPAGEIIHSETQGSCQPSESEHDKSHKDGENPNVSVNLCEWKETPVGFDDEVRNIPIQDFDSPADPLGTAPESPLPLFSCEDVENCAISKGCGKVICEEDSNEVLPDIGKSADPAENAKMPEESSENGSCYQSGGEDCAGFEPPSSGGSDVGNAAEDLAKSPEDSDFHSADTTNLSDETAAFDEPTAIENDAHKKPDIHQVEPAENIHLPPESSERVNFDGDKSAAVDVEMAGEGQNSDGVSRNGNCLNFENEGPDISQDECSADYTSTPKKNGLEVSGITLEDVQSARGESLKPEHTGGEPNGNEGKEDVPQKDDCGFSFAEKTDLAVDVKDTKKDSESESDRTITKDKLYVTSPRTGENGVPSSDALPNGLAGNDADLTDFSRSSQCVGSREDDEETDAPSGVAESQGEDHARGLVSTNLPPDVELEDGEIVDSSSDELDVQSPEKEQRSDKLESPDVQKKQVVFTKRKIERRNSVEPQIQGIQKSEMGAWSERKFSKAKSCPREIKFTGGRYKDSVVEVELEEIPLPLGPPPQYSCFDLKKCINLTQMESSPAEAKEKPKESIPSEPIQVKRKEEFQSESAACELSFPQDGPVPSSDAGSALGIFQRSSKIKFSLTRRSRFSKIVWKNPKEPSPEVRPKPRKEPEKEEVGLMTSKKDTTPVEQSLATAECQSEEVPNAIVANGTEEPVNDSEEVSKDEKKDLEQPVELLGEGLEENIEVIDAVTDYMRDEFYEFEDIPTSEDLTNGDELEIEKVNDDKFRNIMQNCLDNAKKFLNVGNLKLFSCSVDDLLELDCQAPDSALEEPEPQPNHISRDVLLASCEDTNDDLGLSENLQPTDLSMDFVPSLCSDVCPEILPVDNWPYLEEEVPSSPTKSKQDEADLIPSLETAHSNNALNCADAHHQFYPKNGMDRRKRVIGEGCFKRFRRRSLISDGEAIRMCSKIGGQRRNTVDSFGGAPCQKEIRDIKSELLRWTKGKDDTEKQSLKCRLSLEKLRSKHGINFKFKSERMRKMSEDSVKRENGVRKKNGKSLDYKSPSWQPKVMLFRISKNELRKLQKKSKSQKRPETTTAADSAKREIKSNELESQDVPANKKPKPDCDDGEKVYLKLGREGGKIDLAIQNEERLVELSRLESIKGSLSVTTSTDERKRKKSRFRNLHTKRKTDPDASKGEDVPAQQLPPTDQTLVDAEAVLAEMFRDCDSVSHSQPKSTNQVMNVISGEKPKKKSGETHSGSSQTFSIEKSAGQQQQQQHKQREKMRRKDEPRGDKRGEKGDHYKHRDRHKESDKHGRHESGQQPERSRHSGRSHSDGVKRRSRGRSRSSSGGEVKYKGHREMSSGETWRCEVCGFNNAEERVTHIKSHPFHCQSCHLAFKTEVYFVNHLTKKHKNIRNQHHCLLCELSFDTEEQYQAHLETREHRHLESVEKNTINTLFTLLTGAPCPVLGLVEMKPEWLPNQAGTVHFYHQATPLSLALQYLKMHHDLTSFSTISSAHPSR